jgi:hypothetical protein
MLYQTDIECAKCGANLYAKSVVFENKKILQRIEPCARCLSDQYKEGIEDAFQELREIYHGTKDA